MSNLDKEFVPYGQALELKELGFDEVCIAFYHDFGRKLKRTIKIKNSMSCARLSETTFTVFEAAPLYQQAFRWFRERGYDIKVQKESNGIYFGFYWTGAAWISVGSGTYEEAELECLKKLIEIEKKKEE